MQIINRKRAVIYVRVSTKEQVDEGNSLITQQRICQDFALRNNYEVVQVFIEQGESAKTADRTELQKLLAFCADKKQKVNAVVIYKLDRLSRNTDDYSQLRLLLKRYSVEIKSTSEHFENTPVGRFMENTMANIVQFDNDIRAERCAGGMKEAMREGRYVWMAPVGYKNVKVGGKSTIIQDEMSPFILKTFELIASNIYSVEDVRKIVTTEGLTSKSGRPLSKAYFYKILKNELFAGWIVKFGERHRGAFQSIISDDLFNQVQRVLKYKGRKHDAHVSDHPDFPLRKFIVDQNGKKLTGSWSKGRYKKYPYYRFGGNGSNYNRDEFESLFMIHVDSFKFNHSKFKRLKELVRENLIKATRNQRIEAVRIQKYIKELTDKQSGIIKKNLDGFIPDNVMQQQLAIIDRELLDANACLAEIPSCDTDYGGMMNYLKEYFLNPSKIWKEANIGVKTKLQWFQFPSGLVYENNCFGTTELCMLFKAKNFFCDSKSSNVDSSIQFWNQFAIECTYLSKVLHEHYTEPN